MQRWMPAGVIRGEWIGSVRRSWADERWAYDCCRLQGTARARVSAPLLLGVLGGGETHRTRRSGEREMTTAWRLSKSSVCSPFWKMTINCTSENSLLTNV